MSKHPLVIKIVSWLLALIFLLVGSIKLMGNEQMVETFVRFGLPVWLMYIVGGAEVLGSLSLVFGTKLNPKLPHLAATWLAVIILGAIFMHLRHDPIFAAIPTTVILILLLCLLWHGRKKKMREATNHNRTPPNIPDPR